jgi:dUTP pyrophosphatase
MKLNVKVKRVSDSKSDGSPKLPQYQSEDASGCDVYAAIDTEIKIQPLERVLIPTGLAFEIPHGFEIQVRPRSGLAVKEGITVLNSPGTIDADYRGEVKILLINLGNQPLLIRPGDRIAQLVISPVIQAAFSFSDEINHTPRGVRGFGSTGVN